MLYTLQPCICQAVFSRQKMYPCSIPNANAVLAFDNYVFMRDHENPPNMFDAHW